MKSQLAKVGQGQSLGLGSGIAPCPQDLVSVPARPKSPGVGTTKSPSRETLAEVSSVVVGKYGIERTEEVGGLGSHCNYFKGFDSCCESAGVDSSGDVSCNEFSFFS